MGYMWNESSLFKNFNGGSSLAILVYNIDKYLTFLNIEKWLKGIRTYNNKNSTIILIGNKVDLKKKEIS